MSAPADPPEFLTTREVAALLRVRERKVYELAGAGAIPCRRVTGKLLFPRTAVEAWLAGGEAGAPPPSVRTDVTTLAPAPPAVVAGSHDPLLDWAIRASGAGLASLFDGSLDGLARLARGEAVAAGTHLVEEEAGAPGSGWNVAHLRAAVPGRAVVLIEWARRRQGLILATGLDGAVRRVADLAGRRVALRQAEAGGARLFARLLAEAGLGEEALLPLAQPARTETEAAEAVASGAAEAAPGLEAAARAFGLSFLPLVEERFDLAVERRAYFEPPLQRLFHFARSAPFAEKAAALGGYDLSDHGAVHWNAP